MKKILFLICFLIIILAYGKAQNIDEKIYDIEKINDSYAFYFKKGNRSKQLGILKNGKVILPDIFIKELDIQNGKVILSFMGIKGMYDIKAEKWTIPMLYTSLQEYNSDIILATINGKNGIIDEKGTVIVDFNWSSMSPLGSVKNYFIVNDCVSGKYGILNIINKQLTVPCDYDYIEKIGYSYHLYVMKGKKYNLIDINNKILFKTWYDEIGIPERGRKNYIVRLNNKMGVIDANENIVVPIEYAEIDKNAFSDGSFLARDKDGNYGCISIDGRVTLPFKYTSIDRGYYNSSNIIAKTSDKCGVVRVNDGLPYEIASCDYDEINNDGNIFTIKKDGKFGLLDDYGKIIAEPVYDEITCVFKSEDRTANKLYAVKQNGNYSFLSGEGKQLSTSLYKMVESVWNVDGYKSVYGSYIKVCGQNGKCGIVDIYVKEVVPMNYDDITCRKGNYIVVKDKGKLGIYHLLKKEMELPLVYDQIIWSGSDFIAIKDNVFYTINFDATVTAQKIEYEY